MNAAVELAQRDGAPGLPMRKLAQELDLDVSVLYRLFRDKDKLLLALCERAIELALDEIGEAPGAEPWQGTQCAASRRPPGRSRTGFRRPPH
ncbi:helix-turn-helix domain-containing protein [Streptomyces sp. NPDC007164]|uniref:TetR/AcrR family transcriptional regulator n=1 Tax=Streptomyces sp. NPDC007164 TaxID=3156918 RepID=UPI0033D0D247